MAFAQAKLRPIAGAVATIGVSDRVDFLRKTYGLLGIALVAWAALTAGMMRFATGMSIGFSRWAFGGQWNWLLVLGMFMVVGWVAQRMAISQTSRGLQLAGLGIFVTAEALLLQPLLWYVIIRYGNPADVFQHGTLQPHLSGTGASLILEAALITIAIFVGLTVTVFVTKKDFSFMRGALAIGSFGMLGIIIASAIFGFQLGALFCGFGIIVLSGYILYQTSLAMSYFPPTAYVAAALMLFSTVATLFWYVLQLLMSLRRD